MIRNLGQVAAIYIGSSAPRNTNLIWLDNTVVPFVFRAYDGSAWSEIATHKWVRAYVDGWLVTLPPRQLADDGDYMLINSNNVNYKITVKDFVKSAVGNPLDFKGIIRVSADFPNPSTLESGDMYVIITSPAGGTVTDPYSGKTFEDSEKIVWDEVTQSWESLGKIDITVDLTTSYSETEVTIHSSAGKETTIQGATDQLAGVMLPGQYSWLQALSNGSIVPGDPSPLTRLTPAHKHNYNDIINRLVSQQGTGESTIDPMSQKATTDALNLKFDKASVLQVSGAATDKVMSQKAVTDALKTLSDDFNNKLTNYLPLSGGTMTGSIVMNNNIIIQSKNSSGNSKRLIGKGRDNATYIGDSDGHIFLYSDAADISHIRNGTSYKIWDAYNLPTPASTTDLANYLPLSGGTMTGSINLGNTPLLASISQGTATLLSINNTNNIETLSFGNTALDLNIYSSNKDLIHYRYTTPYKIWDSYNLSKPTVYNGGAIGTPTTIYDRNLSVNGTGWTFLSATNAPTTSIFAPTTVGTKGYYLVSSGTGAPVWQQLEDLGDGKYLPLIGGTLTGQLTIKQSVDIKLRLQSTDADNHCIIQAINSQASQLGVFGYAGDKWAIGHNGTYYEIWDKYNLTNPVTYTTNTYNHATLTNKDGQYFTYIKAGTNGLLPHSQVTLANGGSGYLGTSDNSFSAAYINNLYTNRIMFSNNTWTNDLAANRNSNGYLQVLDAYNASSAGGPTNYGTVLQVNSRNAHWANQLWFPGGAEASKKGLYYRHMAYNQTEYGEWNRLLTNKDVNILSASYNNNPNSLPTNQIFYAETQGVAGTPTSSGLLFSVQGDDEGIQLWASSTRTELYYRTKWTSFGNWIKLATTSDLGNCLTKTEASTLYYPYNGRGYLSITSTGRPVMSNNQGYAVKDKDGNEREVLWMGANNDLYLGNTSQYTLNILNLRCVTLTHNGNPIATQNYVTNQLGNYLPLSGGTLSGKLTINTVGSPTLVINNNDTNGSETFMRVLRKGTASAAIGFRDSLGAYIYNYNSNKYLFIDNDGYARVGTTSGSTRLALITDIPTVSGYLPLSGGTLTGALTMSSRRNNVVVDVVGGAGQSWNEGAGALSVQVPSDSGQTPLLLARRSGATINTTTLSERLLDMALLDTGTIFKVGMSGVDALQLEVTSFTNKVGIGKLFGKQIATTDQIPSIPSISISNSGSGNAVTSITASGHTLTVTKGATYLTSSSLDGYATRSWANGQFAPLSRFNTSTGYTTIKVTGQEFNFDSANPEIYMNYRTLSGSTAVTKITWKAGGGANSPALCEGRWGNLYMNNNLVATQSWVNNKGYLTSHQTIYNLTFQAGTFSAKTFDPNGAAATVNIPTNTSHLTNDSGFITSSALNGYATQAWVNSQNFVKSTSTKKVTDIQPVDALPATQASGVLYLVFG